VCSKKDYSNWVFLSIPRAFNVAACIKNPHKKNFVWIKKSYSLPLKRVFSLTHSLSFLPGSRLIIMLPILFSPPDFGQKKLWWEQRNMQIKVVRWRKKGFFVNRSTEKGLVFSNFLCVDVFYLHIFSFLLRSASNGIQDAVLSIFFESLFFVERWNVVAWEYSLMFLYS
jgi:hypothetical protein